MIEYPYVNADCETTGLDARTEEIVEITVKEFNRSGIKGQSKTFLCCPKTRSIPKEASDIHGITIDMVIDKPNYLEGGIREEVAAFIGDRILVGHNIEDFDLKFMKIKPKAIEDTLKMSRRMFPGRSNNLKSACARVNIEWDSNQAHRSGYDVDKDIELFLKLRDLEDKAQERKATTPIFAQMIIEDVKSINAPKANGVIPTDNDKEMFATQAYSYSRINLFKQCPFKWYMQYIRGFKQPDEDYLVVGKVVHKITEKSGEWCFRELFANKFEVLAKKNNLFIDEVDSARVSAFYGKSTTMHLYGRFLFENPTFLKERFQVNGLYSFMASMDAAIKGESYLIPSMPDMESYELIIQNSLNQFNIIDPSIKNDVRTLAERYYRHGNFSLLPGDIVLTEKRMAFDKEWKVLSDFYANNVFFRAIIDVIYYYGRTIVIKDYKTSRTMTKQEEMTEDMQLLTYVLMIYKFIPRNSYDKIIIQVEYVRFGKTIELKIDDVEYFVKKAMKWIADAIQDIEKEMLKADGSAFAPTRNEYCHTCHIGGDGKCPLFNKQFINNIDDPFNFIINNVDDCVRAWKRVEANKSENSRLTGLCKSFVKECESSIIVDGTAILDFYTLTDKEYDTVKTVQFLLKKGMPIENIISFMSFPRSQFEKFLEYKELKLTPEEIENISQEKTKTEFKALTEKERKGYINT